MINKLFSFVFFLSFSSAFVFANKSYFTNYLCGYEMTFQSDTVFLNSTDVPVAISGSGTPTVISVLNVSVFGSINDINVFDLIAEHSFTSDLNLTITSPQGTTVTLFSGICGGDDNIDLGFDDDAPTASIPCPPTDGLFYQANNPLSALNGEQMFGQWILTVNDFADQDGGSLNSWGLNIIYTPTIPCYPAIVTSISGPTNICQGGNTLLTINGSLNDAIEWKWYSGSCNGTLVGSGQTLNVTAPDQFFVRGEGGCVIGGPCTPIIITRPMISSGRTLLNGIITATQVGATYQWLSCPTMAPIAGETNQTFTPTSVGQYAASVSMSGCTVITPCIAVYNVGMDENILEADLFPNPTSDILTIQFPNETTLETIIVTDLTGRIVHSEENITTQTYLIDLAKEAKGIYYVNLSTNGTKQTLRLIKE